MVYSRRPKTPMQHQESKLLANPYVTNSQEEEEACLEDNGEVNDLDLPIAVRKGVRTCTKHPISNHLTYSKLSNNFKAFFIEVDKIQVPRDIHEAFQDLKWKEAVLEEMKALNDNETWELVELPIGKKVVDNKWVFTIKYRLEDAIDR